MGDRRAEYQAEMQRIMAAAYLVIERRGTVDPSLREILRETGLSTQAFYKYFRSKDELLLLLLDDGRRQLLGYLEHRMRRARTDDARVREWIHGVLAQASRPDAAARTRPFVANEHRLVEAFPQEQQASVDALVEQVQQPLGRLGPAATARRNALVVYDVVFAVLRRHLMARTAPTATEIEHVVRFCLRGTGAGPRTERAR